MVTDNTLVSILTTSDSNACVRAYQSAGDCDRVIIVNTPDPDYFSELEHKLPDAMIIQTPCTGTPGTGKQSVWDYFLSTDYDYVIMLEGDDVFLPGAVARIKSLQTELPANAWALSGEDIISDHTVFSSWRTMDLDLALSECDISDHQHHAMKSYMQQVFDLVSHRGYRHQRIIQIDRHIALNYRYNTNLIGSEDVHMTSQLKLNHIKDKIDFCMVDSQEICCYLKNTQTGAGRTFMQADVSDLESEFYQDFTHSDQVMLRNTELLNHKLPQNMSDFVRHRWYLKMLRGRS